MTVKDFIEDYLNNAKILQVATAKDNQPWAVTVYFAFDADLNLYWISKPDRRHSEEIRSNEKVAGTIVLPHTPGDKVRGLQMEGVARELHGEVEVKEALSYYSSRFQTSEEKIQKILANTDGHLVYKITPKKFILFDEVNFPDNPRQEYEF